MANIQHRIVGEKFSGYSDADIRRVRNLALEQAMDAPIPSEESDLLQAAIDECNAELQKRGVAL